MKTIEIRPSTTLDVPDISQVLSQATIFKISQGDHLWGSEPFTEDEVTAKLQAGNLYTVIDEGVVVGTVTLTNTDERVWGADGTNLTDALYIHSLATSDKVRGKGVGEKVINWVVDKAQREQRSAVRLDCSHANIKLCGYYAKQGFKEVGRRDISRKNTASDLPDSVYQVALLQRDVSLN